MTRLLILVEGQTEETFVRDVLGPHLEALIIYLTPITVATKRVKSGHKFKGGVTKYSHVRNDILRLLNDSNAVAVTTMLDYYQLPEDFPGQATIPRASCYDRVQHLESTFASDISSPRFIPFLTLHEFEALLFSEPAAIAAAFPDQAIAKPLQQIKTQFPSPEEINQGNLTHPAARILQQAPGYRKPLHGPIIAKRIGIATIRRECKHFNDWLTRLEAHAGT